jgi:hypothetical protein
VSVIIKRPWTRQPPSVWQVAWSNPLSRGLVAAFVPVGTTVFEVISGRLALAVGTLTETAQPAPIIDGNRGTAMEAVNTGSGTLDFAIGATGADRIAGSFSLFVEGGLRLNGANQVAISSSEASNGFGFWLNFDDVAVVTNGFLVGANNATQADSGFDVLGLNSELYAHRILLTVDGTNWRTYAKNALTKTTANATVPTAHANRFTRVHGKYDATGARTGLSLALVYNVVLSLEQYRALYDNPWQLFAPLPRRIWAPAAGGAAAFKPAWASGATTIVGGGINA